MSALDTKTAPADQLAPAQRTKHIFHMNCNREVHPKTAYCGFKGGIIGITWIPATAKPTDCSLCILCRETTGCPQCGYKP